MIHYREFSVNVTRGNHTISFQLTPNQLKAETMVTTG
jgi:hypothetical protein